MERLGLFLATDRGFTVLSSLIQAKKNIGFVLVLEQHKHEINNFTQRIITLCKQHSIKYATTKDIKPKAYQKFLQDLSNCQEEVIIETPFITTQRMNTFDSIFKILLKKGVKIYIITRDPKEHDNGYEIQSEKSIRWCEALGIQVLLCVGNHHRKLAILDRKLLWEGSLNILSQACSREIMRRIESQEATKELFNFLKYDRYI